MRSQDRVLIPDDELKRWADFFVAAGLFPLMKFSEFIREPEAIVAALCDLSAPLPETLPRLRERVAAYADLRRAEIVADRQRRVAGALS